MNITAITVVYNTPRLAASAINSVKQFYPNMPIIVVNGSTDKHDYSGNNVVVYNLEKNIGHGKGIHFGLEKCKTRYALLFDSDTKMKSPCLDRMKKLIRGKYGVGHVCKINDQGHNSEEGIKYLHPYFALINVVMYNSWHRSIHHGAPLIKAMKEIHEAGMSERLLVDFPVSYFVYHKGRGTRMLRPKEFFKNWE